MNEQSILALLQAALAEQGAAGWLVGGALRDRLLGRTSHDLDVAVAGDALRLAQTVADGSDGRLVTLDAARGTARVVWPAHGWQLDLAQLRGATLLDDLRGRDFTANALAQPLDEPGAALIDPCDGQADIAAAVLRPCSPTALRDDPVRLLRAVRIAATLGWALAPELVADLSAHGALITTVAAERVHAELAQLLALPHAADWLDVLDQAGILTALIPELGPARSCEQPGGYHCLPVLAHLLEAVRCWEWLATQLAGTPWSSIAQPPLAVQRWPDLAAPLVFGAELRARMAAPVDGVARGAIFKLALLLHDNAKPQTKAIKPDGSASFYGHQTVGAEVGAQIARRLRWSRAAVDYIELVIAEHMRPGQLAEAADRLTRRALYRFFTATGDAGPDVLLHMLCDYLAMRGPNLDPARWQATVAWVNAALTQWYAAPETVRPTPLVTGHDLMTSLGIPGGPALGRVLARLREAQATGEITTQAAALALAAQLYGQSSPEGDR